MPRFTLPDRKEALEFMKERATSSLVIGWGLLIVLIILWLLRALA